MTRDTGSLLANNEAHNFNIYSEPHNIKLGIDGFHYADLYDQKRLKALAELFYNLVQEDDADLWKAWAPYLASAGVNHGLSEKQESDLIVKMARHLGRFLEKLFDVGADSEQLRVKTEREKLITQLKRNFIQRLLKKYQPDLLNQHDFDTLHTQAERLQQIGFPDTLWEVDTEYGMARMVVALLNIDKEYEKSFANNPVPVSESSRALVSDLQKQLSQDSAMQPLLQEAALNAEELAKYGEGESSATRSEHKLIKQLITMLEIWSYVRYLSPRGHHDVADWISYHHPEHIDYNQLVKLTRPRKELLPEMVYGPEETLRRRDGFKLTDRRFNFKQVYNEVDYCLYCHERDKDSCSKGFIEKDGSYKKNPLRIPLEGCPLDEKISEAHLLKRDGDSLGALATIIIDNPMAPGTGHRICNDCMKSCIFQKQEPVNIPQVETGILTDVLNMPYGFEIYSLLTRWNPLNVRRPYMLPYNGKNVLVVGLGPAGYTLSHYLLNEGFAVFGVDGLKIEPLPKDLIGDKESLPRPIKDINELRTELDERILSGFGGVSEYGITVRWDKNFLTLIYLNLMRRAHLRVYPGVRFGGTFTIEDAWDMGMHHIAIAAGAGKPTIVPMKNNLIRGIRKASDFLMALQLTGAFKRTIMANLQVQLPAIVIGGGLTGIDTATELMAYYPVQVEKTLDRFEKLVYSFGEERIWAMYNEEERAILTTFLEHGKAVRAERTRAEKAGEEPNFVQLVRSWGGVSLVYRKTLADAPAYRLNHEEVIKALEEGIGFIENLSPVEAVPNKYGAVSAIKFERFAQSEDGKWKATEEIVELPANTVCVAAGTSPNIIYEKEYPDTFQLDKWRQFFAGFKEEIDEHGNIQLIPAGVDEEAFFTSYQKDGKYITYYGDNHPAYAGNVVKAMASAKHGYLHILNIFQRELAQLDVNAQEEREAAFNKLSQQLDEEMLAEVVSVDRLTPTIVEVIVKAPLAARKFQPGQFYRLQNFETGGDIVEGTNLMMEGIALTGAWIDEEKGWLSLIVLEMGVSSRLCASLRAGQQVIVMGPTGTPTEIPKGEQVLLAGGGLGNAVLFSIAKAMRDNGNRIVYFAGYRKKEDLFKRKEIEAATDQVIWSVDSGDMIDPERPQDLTFRGNIVQAMLAYGKGELGESLVALNSINRIIAIGSDRMMAAVKSARYNQLAEFFCHEHEAIGSINSPMQCMMKEVCAQCLQKHIDPATGKESFIFSCFNQDQKLDFVDFDNLNERLRANSVQEKLANLWFEYLSQKREIVLV